jgi:predicted nucleic acid-binding protein
VPGYLFDTNHFKAFEKRDAVLLKRLKETPENDLIWLSPIVIGEVEFGLRSAIRPDLEKQANTRAAVYSNYRWYSQPMEVTTGEAYGTLVAEIFRRYPKTDQSRSTQSHLTELQVDIHDAWLAATAITHNLIFLTADKMRVIRESAGDLRFDNWLV